MKVLILSRYGRSGASSRMRFFQYQKSLESRGISLVFSPLFSDDYIESLQNGNRNSLAISKAYFFRLYRCISTENIDLIWIEKELLPWLPFFFERLFLPKKIPFVIDYDDAVFHSYDQSNSKFVRYFLSSKHSRLIQKAAAVTAGNEYLSDYAKNSGAKNVHTIPTVIDFDRYSTFVERDDNTLPVIGWIGQRSTAVFLKPLIPIFKSLIIQKKARVVAVGINAASLGLPIESIFWSEATEVQSIQNFDIGIMPLNDGPFERGKCGYKLIQYMACSKPVVASPVGVNAKIVKHGKNGFLAESLNQWATYLDLLLENKGLRTEMGLAGREIVLDNYCINATIDKIEGIIRTCVKLR